MLNTGGKTGPLFVGDLVLKEFCWEDVQSVPVEEGEKGVVRRPTSHR